MIEGLNVVLKFIRHHDLTGKPVSNIRKRQQYTL